MSLTFFVFWTFYSLWGNVRAANIPDYEMKALQDLYEATNGSHWSWKPTTTEIGTITHTNGVPWVFSPTANPCTEQWQGLNCTITAPYNYYHIASMVLVDHKLQGTLPPSIGNFTRMHYLNLDKNKIYGTLPQTLTKLTSLLVLSLASNQMHGIVPHSYQALSLLQEVLLNDNLLSGQFPSILTTLTGLKRLNLASNRLSGLIPSSLGSIQNLEFLYLENNYFTGTIPSEVCQLSRLIDLSMFNNSLAGSIPPCLGNMTLLNTLGLNDNMLTGRIPNSFNSLTHLTVLYLYMNLLTGPIPTAIGDMHELLNLNVQSNYLTGSLPAALANLTKMTNVYMNDNMFSGSLSSVTGWTSAIFVYLHHNSFHGALPNLNALTQMTSLFVNNNKLSGRLDGVFSPATQPLITTLQVSDNQLTGTLPESLFRIAQLSTFAAVSNCFSGSLPLSVCNSTSLNTLILDGLHSATSCRNNILTGAPNRYILEENIKGGIPACYFSVHDLRTLHLSGNGLTGNISPNVSIGRNLMDLSLSHNVLTGSIPSEFQSKRWYNLDLSYNKFSGSLRLQFPPFEDTAQTFYNITLTSASVALSLRNNRLSGNLPQRVGQLSNVSVLEGNIFACNIAQTDLPEHDDGRGTYQCGSNSFNVSYYVWVSSVAVLVGFMLFAVFFRQFLSNHFNFGKVQFDRLIYYYDKWMHHIEFVPDRDSVVGKEMGLKNYKYLIYVCEGVCKVSVICTIYILAVLIPLYVSLSHYYRTHEFEYAWEVSAAFLSGAVPLALILLAFVCLLVIAFVLFTVHIRRFLREKHDFFRTTEEVRRPSRVGSEITRDSTSLLPERSKSSIFMKFCVYAIFFLINFAVVLGVNVAYVYVRLYQSSSLLIFAQLLLSVFKIIWNSFCSVYIIRWTDDFLTESSADDWKSKESGFFAIQLFVALFNYIAIPCLVVAVISPDCYNNVIIEPGPVSSRFSFLECELFSSVRGCLGSLPKVATTTYNPPFTYSYECSSSIITFYAPTFVYLGFIVTFINPLLEVLVERMHSRRVRGTWWAGQLDYWVPLILQRYEVQDEATRAKYDIFNPYLDADLLLITIITYLGVLLTFGVVFPPLSVCMLVAILSVTINAKLTVGRFLTNTIDVGLTKYTAIIEGECQGAGSIPKLRMCMRLLLVFSFCFYTPFLFDTLGDSVGLGDSFWVIFFLPLIALVGISVKFLMKKTFPDLLRVPEEQRYSQSRFSQSRFSQSSQHGNMVEMTPTQASPTVSVDSIEMVEQGSFSSRPNYLATPTSSPTVVTDKKKIIQTDTVSALHQ